jgi:hypothetical protein
MTNEISSWAKKDVATGAPQQAGDPGGAAKPAWMRR